MEVIALTATSNTNDNDSTNLSGVCLAQSGVNM